jgi:short-subunit dehydrogenase
VTGSSSGIGKATALRLAREGAAVCVVADRNITGGRAAVAEIQESGGRAAFVQANVALADDCRRVFEEAIRSFGRVDVLVNNAGLGYSNRVVSLDPDQLREEVAVNLVAVIECAQAVLPAMMQQSSGHMINVASIAGLVGLPGSSIYSATKSAVISFSDSLRREVRRHGIYVTAFCPGFVATNFSPRLKQIAASGKRLPGIMRVEYVADRIAWLIRHPRRRLIIPPGWGMLAAIAQAFPWLTDSVLNRYDQP